MLMNRLLTTMSGLLVAAVTGSVVARPAAAQGGVELTPWAGVYIPTSNSFSTITDDFSRDVSVIGVVPSLSLCANCERLRRVPRSAHQRPEVTV